MKNKVKMSEEDLIDALGIMHCLEIDIRKGLVYSGEENAERLMRIFIKYQKYKK